MADNPEARPEKVPAVAFSDTPHAPFIFYENAPAFGFMNGVVNITLSANRTYAGPDGAIVNEQVVVAYLRGNVPAALSLRQAIDSALLLAAPTGQGAHWPQRYRLNTTQSRMASPRSSSGPTPLHAGAESNLHLVAGTDGNTQQVASLLEVSG